jgi:Domain of unknown function (DUF1707)
MTDELPPGGVDAGLRVPALELRASHGDRDEAVEILREAAGDGRLTADELDERLEAALTARTIRDLAVLTADLPAQRTEVGVQAKDLVTINQRFADAERIGPWTVPRRMAIKLTAGDVKLDFTNAVIQQDSLHIDVDLGFGGDLLLITKPGILVTADDLIVRLGDIKIQDPSDPDTPVILRIEVTGRIRGGGIVARHPRRPHRQRRRRAAPG